MTLRNKILISSLAAVVLMGGCGTDATKKGESAILSSVTQLQPIQLEEANTTTRSAYEDTTSSEDLAPDFIDSSTINNALKDQGCKVYEDAEDATTSGWGIYDADPSGADIANVTMEGSHVIALIGDGIKNGFFFRRDNGEYLNNKDARIFQWKGKFSDDFILFVSLLMDNGAVKYLAYSPHQHPQINDIFPFTLPSNAEDGNWHTFTRDLEEDIHHYLPSRDIKSVLDVQVRGEGYLDDISLSTKEDCDSNSSSNGNSNSSIDLRYKVSLDIDYALKIDGAQNVDIGGLPANLQAQIEAILAALNGGGSNSSSADTTALLESAKEVLQLAQNLLTLSQNMPADASSEYIQAMLRLSDDIGKMADRIGEMADRILETEDKIVVVALRMLDTIDKAQETLLQAQKNFNDMLQILLSGGTQMAGQLSDLMTQLQAAIASGNTSGIDTIVQAMQTLLGNMSQLPASFLNNPAIQQMMLQAMTMIQQMMTQMMQGGFTAMNTSIQQFGQLMQQFITAMADPDSGVSPVRMAEVMTGTIEKMMEMSKELLEKSMETGQTEAALQAMQGFSQFMQGMADKALVAMDKMVTMGGMAQDVAFRMLDLMDTTESNLLQAQQNFNNLILGLAGGNSGS